MKFVHGDDDKGVLLQTQIRAKKLGLSVFGSGTPEGVKSLITEHQPEVVVTDLHYTEDITEDRSGYDIARFATEAGVKHVAICSTTETPSQMIPGVEIIEKTAIFSWLEAIVGSNKIERR